MTVEDNKAIVRRFYEEVINRASEPVAHEIMSQAYVEHDSPDQPPGLEGFMKFLRMIATAFPDIEVRVEDMLADGDKVAARLTIHGTHTGTLLGNIAPTGRRATWTGIDILQLEGGKLIGRWSERNLLGLMRQLGVIA